MTTSVQNGVTLYHNPNCSKSRGALELLTKFTQDHNLTLELVEYLQTPPTREALSELLRQLPSPPEQMVRNDKNFKALELNAEDYLNAESVTALLLAHPELMQRPIAVYNDKAAIGRPPEDLLELFR